MIDMEAIATAITERVEGDAQTGRAPLEHGAFSADVFTGADDFTKAQRAIVRPLVDVQLGLPVRDNSTSINSNVWIYMLAVTLVVTYRLENPGSNKKKYNATKHQAGIDCDRMNKALGDPGVLSQTAEGIATGVVSGLLVPSEPRLVRDDFKAGLYEVALDFNCTVKVTNP